MFKSIINNVKETVGTATTKAVEMGGNVVQQTTETASTLATNATGAFDSMVSMGQETLDSISTATSETVEAMVSSVWPAVDVRAMVMPTGQGTQDFEVHVELDEFVSTMVTGKAVRPRMTIFAGRSDIDRDLLGERLVSSFMDALAKERERIAKDKEKLSKLQELRASVRDGTKNKIVDGIALLMSLAVSALIVANPIADIAILAVAVLAGGQGFKDVIKLLGSHVKDVTDSSPKKKLQREQERLDEMKVVFGKMLEKQEIVLEHNLYALVTNILDVHSAAPMDAAPERREDEAFEAAITLDYLSQISVHGYEQFLD